MKNKHNFSTLNEMSHPPVVLFIKCNCYNSTFLCLFHEIENPRESESNAFFPHISYFIFFTKMKSNIF